MAVYFNNKKLGALKYNGKNITKINFNGKVFRLIDYVTNTCAFQTFVHDNGPVDYNNPMGPHRYSYQCFLNWVGNVDKSNPNYITVTDVSGHPFGWVNTGKFTVNDTSMNLYGGDDEGPAFGFNFTCSISFTTTTGVSKQIDLKDNGYYEQAV